MTRNEILQAATRELGVCEVPINSNNVKYNTWFYGKNVSGDRYPWCAAFISWLFRKEQSLCKKTASCAEMLEWFEKEGLIVEKPMAGDLVFFKYSTNNRKANHIGIILSVGVNSIITIEGNTSVTSSDNGGKVMKRQRKNNIVAYARPKYSDAIKNNKSVDVIAKEVIDGRWGNGVSRKNKLTAMGYDYSEIQAKVNELLKR